ncbi:MAG: hypothetical protein J6Y93_03940, partial [Treponema sp.]|nr:hypothetical protein [Treponema sp.]
MSVAGFNIYNIIAELCSHIINSCTEDFFVRYSCVSEDEKLRIDEVVRRKVNIPHRLEEKDLDEQFFTSLMELVSELKAGEDVFAIVGLIQILDDSLESMLRIKIQEFQEDDFSVVLNTNRETTGVGLLPRTSCIWERKHRLSHSYNRMDNFLFNMLLMENTILGELIDRHFFLKKELFPDFA